MQEAVDVVENVLLRDGTPVGRLRLFVDKVVDAVAAGVLLLYLPIKKTASAGFGFFVIIEGEALGITINVEIRNSVSNQRCKRVCAARLRHNEFWRTVRPPCG